MTLTTPNPNTKVLLTESLETDERILAAFNAANPGTLAPTQAVISSTQVINTDDGGTVTLTVVSNAITAAVYAAA